MADNRLRIAILGLHYAPEPTGNAPYTSSLATGLQERGHAVRVITAHPHYPEWKLREGYGGWTRREKVNGVSVTRLRHYIPAHPGAIRRLLSELSFGARLLTAPWGNPDVVILISPALFSTALAAVKAHLAFRRPLTVVWVQDLYSVGIVETNQGGGIVAAAMSAVEARTLGSADGLAVIHERFAAYVNTALNVPSERMEVIRNWSHLPPVPQMNRTEVRTRHGWLTDETVVLHAGNMGAKQALENVVDAARLADQQCLPVRYVMLGDGNQRARIRKAAIGVTRIQFLDPLDSTGFQNALAAADILLVNEKAGVTEMSVPSKLTSYFGTGKPVIAATDVGSVTAGEIETSGAGIRVDAGDPDALNAAVMALRESPLLRAELGAAGLRFRQTHLTQDAAIDHYAEWLTRMSATRRIPGRAARRHRGDSRG